MKFYKIEQNQAELRKIGIMMASLLCGVLFCSGCSKSDSKG